MIAAKLSTIKTRFFESIPGWMFARELGRKTSATDLVRTSWNKMPQSRKGTIENYCSNIERNWNPITRECSEPEIRKDREKNLQSLTSCEHIGRRCPNLGKEESTMENDCWKTEHVWSLIDWDYLHSAIRNGGEGGGAYDLQKPSPFYFEIRTSTIEKDISTIEVQLIPGSSARKIAIED